MYEFHGWISVWTSDPDKTDPDGDSVALGAIRDRLARAERAVCGWFEIRATFNGQIVVVAHGLRNHRQDLPVSLFCWIAEQFPLSYGLLYVYDDEDPARRNEFVVYRLAHGQLTEFPDAFLSPFVPTVESTYNEPGEAPRGANDT